ncbi:WXG100 family type VII secretion target [Streptomyces sp. B-S-A8]|uniref:WXG100 family type VII secretion target n=1 Tax=Streptomyces solicavernae TaxID=3043614 RepID=A0ABT6S135_9ACTN|nr:WXG100 family type VII secretion target [Streptomyces sp. B-S-A8]MDI3390407.1 WXG100 family type VII secretion target [Streptomyces sp. B-S-A8]
MSTSTGGTSLGYTEVAKAKTAIDETVGSMDAQIKTLVDIIGTVSASWSGQGAAQFKKAQDDLKNDHQEILRRLRILHEAVGETKNLSEANDLEVQAVFRGVSGIDNM